MIKENLVKESKPNLKKNFIYNFISQILTLVIPLATTPYLSRILEASGNGQISYAATIANIFIVFASLGFTVYGQREIAEIRDNKLEESRTFWEIIILKLASTFLSGVVFFSIFYTVGFVKCSDLILIFSAQILSVSFDVTFFFYGEENFKAIAIRNIFIKILGLIAVFCFVKTSSDTWKYALILSSSTVLSYIIMWPSLHKCITFVPLKSLSFKRHIGPVLKIFVPQLAIMLYSIMDKAMIGWLATNSDYENGCYEQAYKINSIALLLVTVISPVLSARNSYDFKAGNKDDLKRHLQFAISYVWMMGLPLIAGFAILSNSLSSWFLGSGYEEVPVLMIIMSVRFILSGFSEILGNQLFIAIGMEKITTIATLSAAVVNLIANYLLIPLYGATGAAIGTAICEFVCFFIQFVIAVHKGFFTMKMVFSPIIKYFDAGLMMLILILFVHSVLGDSMGAFFIIMFTGGIFYFALLWLFKDEVFMQYFNQLKSKFKSLFLKLKKK